MVPPAAVAFFPKCPFCWAAYMSALGLSGFEIASMPWLYPVLWGILGVYLASTALRSRATGKYYSLVLATAGAALVLFPAGQWAKLTAIGLIGVGSLVGTKEHTSS